MTVVQALYGHNSFETAYKVDSYPYGSLRCKIWFWIEFGGEKKGYRFVSQTENPKNGRMNAPKKGTYALLAANMYLDENGHVQHAVIGQYCDYGRVLEFIKNFPENDAIKNKILTTWCALKVTMYSRALKKGTDVFGKPLDDHSKAEYEADVAGWRKCYNLCSGKPEDYTPEASAS